jgi:hypothetical protein
MPLRTEEIGLLRAAADRDHGQAHTHAAPGVGAPPAAAAAAPGRRFQPLASAAGARLARVAWAIALLWAAVAWALRG